MNIKINDDFNNISESYLFSDINKRVNEYKKNHPNAKIIRLGIGDVTLPLPKLIVDALVKASNEMGVKDTFRGYPPEYGYDFIKEAVVKYYKNINVNLDLDSVFISDGAKSDLGNIVDILGDNDIYIPNPVYPVYVDSNLMSGRKIHYLNGNEANNFLPLPSGLDNNPKVIYLCSPNNPTGATYNYNELKSWVDYAYKTGSLIIFDSAYEAFITDDSPRSIYKIEHAKEVAIEVSSLSKMAGFTGVRCGFTIVPLELFAGGSSLNKLWKRRQATKFNGVSYPVQRAAEAALSEEGVKESQKNLAIYKKNTKMLCDLFDEKGIWYSGGVNSPYVWIKCPNGMKSFEFFDYLLDKANIVGTPGVGFGENGEGYFRLTSFASNEDTKEAVERLRKIL